MSEPHVCGGPGSPSPEAVMKAEPEKVGHTLAAGADATRPAVGRPRKRVAAEVDRPLTAVSRITSNDRSFSVLISELAEV